MKNEKQKLLLDVCCGVCFAGVFEQLKNDYEVTAYWHNANIFPEEEYNKRLESFQNAFPEIRIIIENNNWSENHKRWLKTVNEQECANEPEGGKRCLLCYKYRLIASAKCAVNNKFDCFASTLTISPHKNAKIINAIAKDIAQKYQIKFFEADFKKKDGFKMANKISKELKIYRQNYCGCEFSLNK